MWNRVTQTEYVVRVSSPKSTHRKFVLHCKQFNNVVCESIQRTILAAGRKAIRELVRKGKLAEGFRVDIR